MHVEAEAQREKAYHLGEYQASGQASYLTPLLAPLQLRNGMSFLDVGCGSGYINAFVAKQFRPKSNTGLELVWDTVKMAQDLNAGSAITWVCGSAESLPVRSASMDCVVCRGVVPLATVETVVKEISRVLTPGGRTLLLLHDWKIYLGWMSLHPSKWKRSVAGALHFGLGLWFNLTGTQLHPRKNGHSFGQTFQTVFRMRQLLGKYGMKIVEVKQGKEFILYAEKS